MSLHKQRNCNHKVVIKLVTVLTVLVQGTFGQSYLLTLGQNQRNYFTESSNTRETFLSVPLNYTDTAPNINVNAHDQFEDNNTTIIVIKSTVHEESNELSQTAMDIITIVWYVATFLALAAFFLLMACSDRRCNDSHRNMANAAANSDTPISPPTPSPSYSEFAPPSYDTVIKMQHAAKTSIFVIPFTEHKESSNNSNVIGNTNTNTNNTQSPTTPTTPAINYYTINELQKLGS